MERLSRRDFLKTSLLVASSGFVPDFLARSEILPPEPLTELPVLFASKTPVYIEHLTVPGYEMSAPEAIEVSNVPLDILAPVAPDSALEIPNPLGPVPWTANLPHVTFFRPSQMKAVVGWGDKEKIHILNGSLTGKKDNFVSSYAFSDRLGIYPSKIYNDLSALALIALWHKENGPFLPGQTYSYLELTGVVERVFDDFILGQAYYGGGICATVSTISKCVFLASQRGNTRIVEKWPHSLRNQYAENSFDPGVTKQNSDATVKFYLDKPAAYSGNTDFRFALSQDSEPLFFSFGAQVYPDAAPAEKTRSYRRHAKAPADARLIFSVSLVKEDPNLYEDQYDKLMGIRDAYASFHNFDDLFALNRYEKSRR